MSDLLKKKIVIGDVAKLAKVSTATVSRVVNGFDGVSPGISSRVNSAIKELGYIPLAKNRDRGVLNKYIGIVVPHIENPYINYLVRDIQNTLDNLGYTLAVMDSKNDPDKSMQCVQSLIESGIVGLIYVPTHKKCKQELGLESLNIPIVFLGRKVAIKDISFVGSDTFTAAFNGANYLLSLGHKDILHITGDKNSDEDSTDRHSLNGFLKAHNEKNLDFNNSNLISGDYDLETAKDLVTNLLPSRTFTAIFTSGDVMAYGAYKAVTSAGLKVPEDISILGFDDLPMSSVLELTTISQNSFGIGQNAGLLLIDLIEKRKSGPQEIILPTNLCIRSSCGIKKDI